MPASERHLRFGPFQLDTQCGQLRKDGVGLKLQGQPVQILEILLERPRELVTREELRKRLWSTDTFVDFDHSLNAAMQRLRQALGDDPESPIYIGTIPKRGYRFIGELTREETKEQSAPVPRLVDGTVEKIATTLAEAAIKPRLLRLLRILAISLCALLPVGAAVYWVTLPPPRPRIVASRALTRTGFRKWSMPRLVTEGKSVYFQESRPSGLATMQVGVGSGEVSQVSVSANDVGSLRDISEDGSQLLLAIFDPKTNHYDAWIQPLPTGSPRRIVADARWPIWSKDGQYLFFVRNDRELHRAKADGTGAQLLAVLTEIFDLAISPDGRRLRFQARPERTLWEMNTDGSNPRPILSKPDSVNLGGWSPDGKFFFFSSWAGDRSDLWVMPETSRWWPRRTPVSAQLTFGPVSFNRPIVSKDGKHLYVAGVEHHGELSMYDPKRRELVPYLSGLAACYVDFSRDGQWIAYVSFPDGNLWRSRIDGTERMQLTSPPIAVINPRWSPDGKLITFNEISGGNRRLLGDTYSVYVISGEGGSPMLLLSGDPRPHDPTWSPDGRAIAYGTLGPGGVFSPIDIRIIDLSTQKWIKVPGSESLYSPRWSPDGKYLAALAGWPASRLMIFSFVTQAWEEMASGIFIGWPAWSRDSRFIFAEDHNSEIIRIGVVSHKKEVIANIAGFRSTAYYFWRTGWWGVTPDGKPITTRDTSLEEIYVLDLEYK